jgi:hypothetical protein
VYHDGEGGGKAAICPLKRILERKKKRNAANINDKNENYF